MTRDLEAASICVLGVPFDLAVSYGKGAALAPEKIRSLSRYMPATTETGLHLERIRVYDAGDVALDLNWERYFKTVEEEALKLLRAGKFGLFLGGDHSVTIPLQRAFKRCQGNAKIGVIYLDAHCDLCDSFDGHHWSHACTGRRMLEHVCTARDLTLVGTRSYEMEELDFIRAHPEITIIHARDVYSRGPAAAWDALKRYSDYDAVYLSLDIDVLDPAFAPGTGTPEPGGLSSRELMELVRQICTRVPVRAMDVVEVSPGLDQADITSWAALKIIYEVFGCLAGFNPDR